MELPPGTGPRLTRSWLLNPRHVNAERIRSYMEQNRRSTNDRMGAVQSSARCRLATMSTTPAAGHRSWKSRRAAHAACSDRRDRAGGASRCRTAATVDGVDELQVAELGERLDLRVSTNPAPDRRSLVAPTPTPHRPACWHHARSNAPGESSTVPRSDARARVAPPAGQDVPRQPSKAYSGLRKGLPWSSLTYRAPTAPGEDWTW